MTQILDSLLAMGTELEAPWGRGHGAGDQVNRRGDTKARTRSCSTEAQVRPQE